MTTELDPLKIIQILDTSTKDLNSATLAGLQQARAQALQMQARKSHILRFAGHDWSVSLTPHSIQQWAVAALLLLSLIAGAGMLWQQSQVHHVDLDEQILTDELPIEIFID